MTAYLAFMLERSQIFCQSIKVFENLGGLVADQDFLKAHAVVWRFGVRF